MKKVKHFLAIALLFSAGFAWAEAAQADEKIDIMVNRSPTCSCCGKWIEHLKQNSFNVKDVVSDDVQAVKNKYGVTQELASCHTAIVNGYVVEGHVPANDIRTLLKNKPDVVGITVPGMPTGTPGMEMGGKKDAYQVISFDKKNQHQVFSSYKAE
ncbi:DUF411 domain-containing protein [Methyloglobulus sp.]|uniref:DUF411 domain-containing protein n=1 Tax=Methyloglobulus sp. TaxID=2518622 RepID=UPI0032B85D38